MGSKDISFASENADSPAKFYLNSAPAHMTYPTVLIKPEGTPEDGVVIVKDCNKVELGSLETANHRTICKYILPGQVESCQLEMGMTKLEPGSVWNTMPCHTHDRRMEVYLYFDMPKDALVMHYMGEPTETRHIVCATNRRLSLRAGPFTPDAVHRHTLSSGEWLARIRTLMIWMMLQ